MKHQSILSGVQPSGKLHIGNYLGAIKQFVALQNEYDAYFCVVDHHAITVPQDPKELREHTLAVAMAYLAAGIDPQKSVIFVQSHVPAHVELGWIFNTMTPLGELERMTQFKDKARPMFRPALYDKDLKALPEEVQLKNMEEASRSIPAGLLNYPTLMAADILLYQPVAVPVGEDQVQHIELTREIARRFNNRFGDTFTIPKPLLQKTSARVMALDDPIKKMSKSAPSETSYIALSDTPDIIRKKIKSATTDSEKEIHYDPGTKAGISNLLSIASEFSGKSIQELEKEFSAASYAVFKDAVAEYIISGLASFQERYQELEKNHDELMKILANGKEKAEAVANKTLRDVKEKMGFLM
ncbi:MAG: tryptophan--tRNA ligase [Candidatus Sungbacteria bacterium]|nr:tryptophan--tRNA ligase [bacterium]MDZ4260218.1 tryptophan--tRNA ligase [Candidatus Sungbacteria bacterium]